MTIKIDGTTETITVSKQTGPTGPTGPQGQIGNTGAQGDQGIQGVQGLLGPTGNKGDQGNPGIQGQAGAQGATGTQGIKGDTGATGSIDTTGIINVVDSRVNKTFVDALNVDAATLDNVNVSALEKIANKNQVNGYAGLDSAGKVANAQLPSYVDDVVEYANFAGFPATGETGKIYVAIDTGDVYRWGGSSYVQINDAVTSADQATKLATARNIALTGPITGTASFDGTAAANISTTLDISGKTTSDLSEGSNLYYTDTRARSSVSATGSIAYNSGTGIFSFTQGNTDTISEGSTNLYYTDARVQTVIDSNSAGFITPSSSSALTNKTGNISQWTNDSGYLTSESDSQTLSFSSPSISITGGNSINISALTTGLITASSTDTLTNKTGNISMFTNDAGYITAETDSQTLSFSDPNLTISNGNTVDLSALSSNPFDQTLNTTDDVTFNEVTGTEFIGNLRGANLMKASAGEALTKGDVVYISGISGNTPVVSKADADDSSKMPAVGLANATVSLNGNVDILTFGEITGIDTTQNIGGTWAEGDSLYINTTAGQLTKTQPSGESSQVQKIGKIEKVHASTGIILIQGAGRSNATPNLDDGKIFIGNGSNYSVTTTLDSSIVPENTNLYYTDARVDARITAANPTPTISSISPSTITNAESTITITGSNYLVGTQVEFINTSTGIWYPATTIVYNNGTSLTATITLSVDAQYRMRIENPDGNAVISTSNILTVSDAPTWTTSAGSLGSFAGEFSGDLVTVAATSDSAVTFTETTSVLSGAGVTLSSAGVLSTTDFGGSSTSATTYNFTLLATDAEGQTAERSFSFASTFGATGGGQFN